MAGMPATADAVSWHAGAISVRIGEGRKLGERAGELADVGAGRYELGSAGQIEVERVEDFAAPLFFVELDELRVGRVGVLGNARAAPVREQILGQVHPLLGLGLGQSSELVGVELVDGIEREDLNAGQLAHALLAALAMRGALGFDGARIAIAEGIGERQAFGVHADIVDGPAIDRERADALGGDVRRTCARPSSRPLTMQLQVPAQAAVDLAGVVGEAMNELDGRLAVLPAKQGDAAALRAQIDCD